MLAMPYISFHMFSISQVDIWGPNTLQCLEVAEALSSMWLAPSQNFIEFPSIAHIYPLVIQHDYVWKITILKGQITILKGQITIFKACSMAILTQPEGHLAIPRPMGCWQIGQHRTCRSHCPWEGAPSPSRQLHHWLLRGSTRCRRESAGEKWNGFKKNL